MIKNFVASNGFSVRIVGDGIYVDNLFIGKEYARALSEFGQAVTADKEAAQ